MLKIISSGRCRLRMSGRVKEAEEVASRQAGRIAQVGRNI
jgi:hypothetical protein